MCFGVIRCRRIRVFLVRRVYYRVLRHVLWIMGEGRVRLFYRAYKPRYYNEFVLTLFKVLWLEVERDAHE